MRASSALSHTSSLLRKTRSILPHPWLLAALCLALILTACSAPASTPASQASATTTPTPAGPAKNTVLFAANWAQTGLTDWKATRGWKVVKGELQTDLSDEISITAPYMPTVPNYAVEFQVQIVSVPRNGGYFFLSVDQAPNKDGLHADILNLLAPGQHGYATHPLSEVLIDPEESMGSVLTQVRDYEPGPEMRTYRIEVQGNQVDFFIDSNRVSRAASTKTKNLSSGPIRLNAGNAILRVGSFRIIAL